MNPYSALRHSLPSGRIVIGTMVAFLLFVVISTTGQQAMLHAQDLTVLAAKGAPTIKSGNAAAKPLSAGMKLKAKDVVTLNASSYLVLTAEGKTLELKSEGTFTVADLNKRLQTSSGGIGSKLASYVFNEIKQSTPNTDQYRQNMSAPASVDRAKSDKKVDATAQTVEMAQTGGSVTQAEDKETKTTTDIAVNSASDAIGGLFGISVPSAAKDLARKTARAALKPVIITAIFPRSTSVTDSVVDFYWGGSQTGLSYTFRIKDATDRAVVERTVSDSTLSLNLTDVLAERGQCYRWSVCLESSPDVASEEFCLSRPYAENEAALKDTTQMLRRELGSTALGSAALGVLCQRNSLQVQAFQAYRAASRLAPQVEEFQTALRRLLEQWGVPYYPVYDRILRNDSNGSNPR